jgi:hypothetical protein
MAESLTSPANACRYPKAALALANASVWENVRACLRCRYGTHRLIHSNRSALGPCCAYPQRYAGRRRGSARLAGSNQLADCLPRWLPLLDRKLHTNCGEQTGSRPGKINDDERRSTEINDDEPVRSRERL